MSKFNEFGRCVPVSGARVYNPEGSRRYFVTLQPEIDYKEIYDRSVRFLGLTVLPFTPEQFATKCEQHLEEIKHDQTAVNVTNGVHIPFICPPLTSNERRFDELHKFAEAAGASFKDKYPGQEFFNQARTPIPDDYKIAPDSRYEQFENARRQGVVTGWYFPTALTEYDLESQRNQVPHLPPQFILSGGAEVAAALVGCPGLLLNKEQYPNHLCLSALQDPDERYFVSFESYGQNLVFKRRSNVLTPTVKQLSEQFSGGLTMFKLYT